MDYILARWFIIKNMPQVRLKQLHAFESAVFSYSAKLSKTRNKNKIFMPLWWQEGAMFLNKEFKSFWGESSKNAADIKDFKKEAKKILTDAGLNISADIFKDINFMHQCDQAINASFPATTKPTAPKPASASYLAAF